MIYGRRVEKEILILWKESKDSGGDNWGVGGFKPYENLEIC